MADLDLRYHALVYRKMAGARIRADWQYRLPFVLYTVTQGMITFVDFLAIAVIFGRIDRLGGWSVAEVAFLFGTSSVAFQTGDVFISQCERAAERVKAGTFDVLLVRPLGTLFQLCADDFAFRRVGKLAQGWAVLLFALVAVDVDWTVGRVLMVPAMLVCGTVIFSAIWVTTSALAMWIIDASEVMNLFTYGSSLATQYPFHVFVRWLRRLFTFVVPAAFVNYYPALYVLGRAGPGASWLPFAAPLVAALLVAVARWSWTSAIRHYRSTGS